MKRYLLNFGLLATILFNSILWSQTFTTIAEDDANNYSDWNGNPSFNEGIGFENWTFNEQENGGSAGKYIGGTAIGNPSFGLFSGGNVAAFVSAEREFTNSLQIGDKLSLTLGHTGTINGELGLNLLDGNDVVFTLKFFVSSTNWTVNDGGSDFVIGQAYDPNTPLTFELTFEGNNQYSYSFGNASGSNFTFSGPVTNIDGVRFFSINQGGGENFGIDNLKIERPTYNTIADGNFSDTSTWENGDKPEANGIININHDVLLDEDYTLAGNLNIAANKSFSINEDRVLTNLGNIIIDGDLVFKSTITGTAQYGNSSGSITGDVTVERYIPAKRAFRLLSSAVGGESIANAWQQDTHITGTGGATNGFDVTGTNNPSMFTFDNTIPNQSSGAAWQAVTNTSTTITAATPYRLMIRGDRTINLTDNAAPATATTLSATGSLYTGSYTPTLATEANNYSFVGNPYQAVVDFDAVTTSNLTGYLYVWDASIAGDNGRGGYTVVDAADGSEVTGISPYSSAANQYIMPGQAFFVQNNGTGNGSITFEEVDKATAQPQTEIFNTYTNFYINSRLYKTSALENNEMESDAIGLRFNEDYTTIGSDEDASKLANPGENYAIVNNGFKSIDKQNIPTDGHQVDLLIVNYEESSYSLSFTIENQPETLKVYLNDSYLTTQTELTESTTYNFTVDANVPESIDQNRFHLSFETVPFSNENFNKAKISLYPNPVVKQLQIELPTSMQLNSVQIFNLLGQEVVASTQSQVDVSHLKSGVYLVEMQTSAGKVTKKIIKE